MSTDAFTHLIHSIHLFLAEPLLNNFSSLTLMTSTLSTNDQLSVFPAFASDSLRAQHRARMSRRVETSG